MSAVHFLRKAAELNLDGVFFGDPRHFENLKYGTATTLRERAEALGLYVEIGMNGANPTQLEDLVRRGARARVADGAGVTRQAPPAHARGNAGAVGQTLPRNSGRRFLCASGTKSPWRLKTRLTSLPPRSARCWNWWTASGCGCVSTQEIR